MHTAEINRANSIAVKTDARSLWLFVATVAAGSVFFSNRFVAGVQSTHIERFTDVFIPILTVWVHLVLLWLLPSYMYLALASLDTFIEFGLATYHDYFRENLDVHTILGGYSEGLQVSGYILDLIPMSILTLGMIRLAVLFWLAPRVKPMIPRKFLAGLSAVAISMFGFAVYKIPLSRATLITDYTICIKVHGYYTALLSDLLYTGPIPSQKELLTDIEDLQAAHPVHPLPFTVDRKRYHNLLVIQVESLDFNILGFKVEGKEVTPFLNTLKNRSTLTKLHSFHYGASGSSGADFQFLTGHLPLQNYPTLRVSSFDYSDSLPHVYLSKGIHTYAFHGNTASMWGRGIAYKMMRVKRFYDFDSFRGDSEDSQWGISDESFFKQSKQIIEHLESSPKFLFLITLSSHGPFDFVKHQTFHQPGLAGKYFNAIHYVDGALQTFLTSLKGSYLVILYGDHSANVQNGTYSSRSGNEEYVPGMFFILKDGRMNALEASGSRENLLNGEFDIRSLYEFARVSFP